MRKNKRFLIVIISCNRLLYLKNCIKSVLEFAWNLDEAEYFIIDLGTIEDDINLYLQNCHVQGFSCRRFLKRSKNELYIAMNLAIEYAQKHNIPYIYFIQDDQQFVWKDKHFLQKIDNIFENDRNIFFVRTSLPRKFKLVKDPGLDIKMNIYNNIRYYKFNFIFQDYGVFRTELFNIIGKYPKFVTTHSHMNKKHVIQNICGEHWMRNLIIKKYPEMSMALLCDSNILMIPDVCVVRGSYRYGHYCEPTDYWYLEPFGAKQIELLKSNKSNKSNELNIFEEDFVKFNTNLKSTQIDVSIREKLNVVPEYPKNLYGTFPFVPKHLRKRYARISKEIDEDRYNIKKINVYN